MPIRFSTEAANADILGDDADTGGAPQGTPKAVGADGIARQRFTRSDQRERTCADAPTGEVKPGNNIHSAGFVKDKDSPTP